jgi:hypothetical protein
MSDIIIINDQEQLDLTSTATNGAIYLKASGSTDAGSIVVYDSGAWKTFSAPAWNGNTYSVSLNGINDYVQFTSTTIADGPRTFSAWVNFSSFPSDTSILVPILGSSVGTYKYLVRGIHWNPNNKYLYMYDDNQSVSYRRYTGTVSINTWYHVMVVEEVSGSVRFYVDGMDMGATSSRTSVTLEWIGKAGKAGSATDFNYFPGLIDEVAIWESDESANLSQIIDTSGANPVPGNLSLMSNQPLHWWRMGDNNGGANTTVTDQGSGSNNGTLTHDAAFSTTVPS